MTQRDLSLRSYHKNFGRPEDASTSDPFADAWLQVAAGGSPVGTLRIALRDDIAPRACENFRALCSGDRGIGRIIRKPLHYKGSPIHRVVKGFVIQAGDIEFGDGRGGQCVFDNRSGQFDDEGLGKLSHRRSGVLSMANSGPNTNRSQFFVTLGPAPHLDGSHVAFGEVVSGTEVLRAVERVDVDDKDRPVSTVEITDCGLVSGREEDNAEKRISASLGGATERVKESVAEVLSARRKGEQEESSAPAPKRRRQGWGLGGQGEDSDSAD
eukprot:Hpha_TRINITY_DN35309_c0_g1::TRINITY_DN35309_c0_g1_i1::g.85112::m.85112